MKKLSTTKRIKCENCGAFIRENLMPKHKCKVWREKELDKIVERMEKK